MLSGAWYWKKVRYDFTNPYPEQPLLKVESVTKLADHYDVIVTGSDPEGIAAAVSAARNGQSVLLADGKHRTMLGGLMTEGGLNTIDFNYAPEKKNTIQFSAQARYIK